MLGLEGCFRVLLGLGAMVLVVWVVLLFFNLVCFAEFGLWFVSWVILCLWYIFVVFVQLFVGVCLGGVFTFALFTILVCLICVTFVTVAWLLLLCYVRWLVVLFGWLWVLCLWAGCFAYVLVVSATFVFCVDVVWDDFGSYAWGGFCEGFCFLGCAGYSCSGVCFGCYVWVNILVGRLVFWVCCYYVCCLMVVGGCMFCVLVLLVC